MSDLTLLSWALLMIAVGFASLACGVKALAVVKASREPVDSRRMPRAVDCGCGNDCQCLQYP